MKTTVICFGIAIKEHCETIKKIQINATEAVVFPKIRLTR